MLFHFLVALQFASVAGCIISFGGDKGPGAMLTLCLAGAVLGVYTLWHNRLGNFNIYPQVKDSAQLIVSGPYRFIRHPMYTSLLLVALGFVLYNGHMMNVVSFAILVVVLFTKAINEERFLSEKFTGYRDYMSRTSRFLPYVV